MARSGAESRWNAKSMNLPGLIETYGYWAVLVGIAIVGSFIGDLKHYEAILLAVLAAGGLAFWWYSRRRTSKS